MSADSQLMTWLVRMVVPMRREYGLTLDLQQFVRDRQYASTILGKARTSADPRLRDYAGRVEAQLYGPRMTGDGVANAAEAAAPAAPAPPAANPTSGTSEQELRARMMKKYTTGLR
jgi:hypothetical protein